MLVLLNKSEIRNKSSHNIALHVSQMTSKLNDSNLKETGNQSKKGIPSHKEIKHEISKATELLNSNKKNENNGALSVRDMPLTEAKGKHSRAKSTTINPKASEPHERRSFHSTISTTQLKDMNFISQGIEYFELQDGNDTLITETNEITDICKDIVELKEAMNLYENTNTLLNGKYKKLSFFHKILAKEIKLLKEKALDQETVKNLKSRKLNLKMKRLSYLMKGCKTKE